MSGMEVSAEQSAFVGAVLNRRWRIGRPIGAGGLGLVFEVTPVHPEASGGIKAAKLLRAEYCDDPRIVERFLAEAQASARIGHPGITHVEESARAEDGTPYLIMERLRGMPLSELMNRGRVSEERAVELTLGILDALGAVHDAGVVHRDLKPDNVFVLEPGARQLVSLLDLGLARVIEVAGGMARKTRTGMMLGTPGYMSPEQMKSAKDAGIPADLWAVGVMFYEMLTGARAFAASNEFERMTKVMTTEPPPIEQVAAEYAPWSSFFKRALARDPGARFASAREMAAALRAAPASIPAAPSTGSALRSNGARPARALFGGVDTEISPGTRAPAGPQQDQGSDPAPVRVVRLEARRLSLSVAGAVALGTFLCGLLLGYWLGAHGTLPCF